MPAVLNLLERYFTIFFLPLKQPDDFTISSAHLRSFLPKLILQCAADFRFAAMPEESSAAFR
jgi:hypothetical protein